jgi:predicted transcriptional regulator
VVSIVSAISAICNEKALSVFKTIAHSEKYDTPVLITKLGLTNGQFYSIIIKLIDADLIKKTTGKYRLTSLGRVVFSAQKKVEIAIENYWNLKALDSIVKSRDRTALPAEEYQIIIDNLIWNNEIKKCIMKSAANSFLLLLPLSYMFTDDCINLIIMSFLSVAFKVVQPDSTSTITPESNTGII